MTFPKPPRFPQILITLCLHPGAVSGFVLVGKFLASSLFSFPFFFPLENARSQTPAFPRKRCFGEIFIRKS